MLNTHKNLDLLKVMSYLPRDDLLLEESILGFLWDLDGLEQIQELKHKIRPGLGDLGKLSEARNLSLTGSLQL